MNKLIEDITDDDLAELWPVIGGAPHLFEYGKDDLRNGIIYGTWEEGGLTMDYCTMNAMVNKLKELGYDPNL